MMLKEGLGVDIISVENREVKAVKPEKWISVESQPKQMPITTMENITLTDTREIESSLIGGEMAKKIKKMLTQPQQIENTPAILSRCSRFVFPVVSVDSTDYFDCGSFESE